MQKTLLQIAEERNFTPEHISKVLHHVARQNGKTWTHTRNVFTGKANSKFMSAHILAAMNLPEARLTGRVENKSGNGENLNPNKPTPCRCVTCERLYVREIFWTGTLPARIRCPQCNQLMNIKDYCEVFGWAD